MWNAANRLETMGTVAATMANYKNAAEVEDAHTEACNVSKQDQSAT